MGLLFMWPRWELSQHFLELHPVPIHKNIHFSTQWFNMKWKTWHDGSVVDKREQSQPHVSQCWYNISESWAWWALKQNSNGCIWESWEETCLKFCRKYREKICRNNSNFAEVCTLEAHPLLPWFFWVFSLGFSKEKKKYTWKCLNSSQLHVTSTHNKALHSSVL